MKADGTPGITEDAGGESRAFYVSGGTASALRFVGKDDDLGPYEFSPFAPAAPTNVKFGPYDAAPRASVETGASATILEEALTADAAGVCVAEEVEFVASFESASRGGRSTARSDAVSEAFAEFFAEDDGEDDFWFEFEKAAGKRR